MKILHVAATYLPATRYGGPIVSVHGLCRALAARGHDVHVFTTSVDGPGDSPVPHGEAVLVDGVRVWYFRSPFARRVYWSPALGAALRARVREFGIVHLHAMFVWPTCAAARTARDQGVPYVFAPRGMLERDLIARRSPWLKSAWMAWCGRGAIERAAALHVTSGREAAEARRFGLRLPPIVEVPNGVDADSGDGVVSPAVRAAIGEGPFILALGRVSWKKGLDRLIAALPLVPNARLLVAGNDEEGATANLMRQAGEAQVAGRVGFIGPVHGADKRALLQSAQLLVVPSYSENFGNVVVEGMAAGRAVVVTPEVGAAPLVASSGAGEVIEGRPEVLAAGIARLLADDRKRDAMGARGRAAAAQLSWGAIAARMEEAYEQVLAARTR